MRNLPAVVASALLIVAPAVAHAPSAVPIAPVIPVVDDYYGTRITDSYRWMEDRHDPRMVAWLHAEDAHARSTLAAIPGIDALERRIAAVDGAGDRVSVPQPAAGRLFYLKRPSGAQTAKLYVRDDGGPERLLLDPDRAAGAGTHGAIDFFTASPDGSLVAVSVSTGGSENGVLGVVDARTGRALPDRIDRVEDGRPSWLLDSSGFFYNRFAAVLPGAPETEKYFNSRAMLHRLSADAASDVALIGTGVAGSPAVGRVDYPYVFAFPGSRWAVAQISHGASNAADVLVAPLAEATRPGAHWRTIATAVDEVVDAEPVGDRLFVLTHHGAPRYRLLELNAATGALATARVAVPASERVIQGIAVARDAIYLQDLDGGIGRLRRLDLANGRLDAVDAGEGSVLGVAADPTASGIVYGLSSWLAPERVFSLTGGRPRPLALGAIVMPDTSGLVAEELRVPSWDGTLVPLSVIHRRDLKLDGANPIWLTGYGAYGSARTPTFTAAMLPFLEDGGVYAIAHVRGGGEFGEEWHLAGFQATKPNTYKDLIASAQYLQAHGYGAPATTAIQGGSAGGITVGMALTQRPDLFRAVFDDVGDNNTLRAENGTDGEANALEYGSVKTRAGFDALYAVDATQHVRGGTAYPAVLLTTGYNDPRVAPFQPGKMAAHLQAATSGLRPILLRVDFDAGHGIGSTRSQRERELADKLGFLYWQIGRPDYQPPK